MNLTKLRDRKKELKMTNKDIAQITKLPLSTIEQIMCGKVKNPRIDTIEAIEHALGLDDITPEEFEQGVRKFKKEFITADEDELLYLFREIGKKNGEQAQQAILTVIENMLK